jgi:3-oxoadipate enol-lactonase
MKTTANGLSIHYTLEGPTSAPVVTMSHSLAANLTMWDPQVPALTSKYRVLRYDTRGHGGSEAADGAYSFEHLAEDVRALLQNLGIERTHFIGLSMGGMIGQVLGLKHPEVLRSLILCDTSSRVPQEAKPLWEERIETTRQKGMGPHVETTIERWFTAPFRQKSSAVVDRVRGMIRATNPKGYIGCGYAIMGMDLTSRLSEISLPTLIIVGEEDQGTPVSASEAIQREIRGSGLVVLKSAAHLSNMEQPEAFNRAVTAFLEKVGGA